MPVLNAKQITEINILIAEIEKSLQPTSEIGARDKASLSVLLKANQVTNALQFFKCKREYSDAIVSYFVKEKGVMKNRFNMNSQSSIFVLTK